MVLGRVHLDGDNLKHVAQRQHNLRFYSKNTSTTNTTIDFSFVWIQMNFTTDWVPQLSRT